jgi:serine protease Do
MIKKIIQTAFFTSLIFGNSINDSRETAITKAIKKIGPAVVSINVEQRTSNLSFDPFLGFMYPREIFPMKSSGSGVVISPDGFVLTNSHVIKNANKISVILYGGSEHSAEVVGIDATTDLALLKLNGQNFQYAKISNSDNLIIGEWVIALGNPFQLFAVNNKPSASVGIISATNMDFGVQKSGRVFQNMIQTDAAINPGNSGGPLVNAMGEIIGINTFIFSDSDYASAVGIGFAIPINSAMKIAEELRTTGHVDRGYTTGLIVQTVNKTISNYLNLPFINGVIIIEVAKNSPADKVGLKSGDVILTVNGQNVNKPRDIRNILLENDLRAGDNLKIKVYKNDKYEFKKLQLGKFKP